MEQILLGITCVITKVLSREDTHVLLIDREILPLHLSAVQLGHYALNPDIDRKRIEVVEREKADAVSNFRTNTGQLHEHLPCVFVVAALKAGEEILVNSAVDLMNELITITNTSLLQRLTVIDCAYFRK